MDKIYWADLNKYPPLKKKEELEIAKKAKTGDRKSYEILINSNLRFVINVAKEYMNQGIDLEELVAYGNLGLCKAYNRYDPETGYRFITYAVWWIRQAILHALSKHNYLVNIPQYKRLSSRALSKARDKLQKKLQREVSDVEIEEELNMKVLGTCRIISLDQSFAENPKNSLRNIIEDIDSKDPEAELDNESFLLELKDILKDFTEREKIIIKKYHGIGIIRNLTLEEIGVEFGITRERVRQTKKKVLQRLKHKSRSDRLKQYLDVLQSEILNDLSCNKQNTD